VEDKRPRLGQLGGDAVEGIAQVRGANHPSVMLRVRRPHPEHKTLPIGPDVLGDPEEAQIGARKASPPLPGYLRAFLVDQFATALVAAVTQAMSKPEVSGIATAAERHGGSPSGQPPKKGLAHTTVSGRSCK